MILFIIIDVLTLIFVIYYFSSTALILNAFHNGNTIVFGAKGKGKDLIFQWVINKRKKTHYSNITYSRHTIVSDHSILNVFPNNSLSIIKGEYYTIKKDTLMEGKDFYISDAGIIFPNYLDNTLLKTFPYMPVAYALSRQLWGMNIHLNSQALDRVWKPLREQADHYIKATGVIKLPLFLIVTYRYYDKHSSALNDLRPFKVVGFSNEFSKAQVSIEKSKNGNIKEGFLIIPKWTIKYDTRIFHKYFFGFAFKKKKNKKNITKKIGLPPKSAKNGGRT